MVRVLSVYHFADQTVHKIEDIIDSCLIGSNKLAVATPNLDVEIWDLNSTPLNTYPNANCYIFPTVDEVEQIVYCPNGNYLATIESKLDNKNRVRKYVRIYTNWDSVQQNVGQMINFRARIAGKVTPSDKYLNSNDLEMIELPLKMLPNKIACCQSTGNIAISCDNRVIFFEFRLIRSENGRHEYIDFMEIPFHVELTFQPTMIQFSEGVVCCCDRLFLNLFKIQKVGEQSISVSVDSFSSEICSNQINMKDTIDFRTIAHQKMLNKEIFRVEMVSDSEDFGHCDIKPEVVNEMLVVLRGHNDSELMNKYSIKSLLQLKLRTKIRSFCDSFTCLALKPIFRTGEEVSLEPENIFQSKHSKGLISVALVIATQQDAYLYNFQNNNNDEWRNQPELLASYSFTSPVIDLVLDDTVLHALTETGVETYTLRIGQKIFYSSCEFLTSATNQEEIIRPNLEDPICLVGIRPFLSVKRIFSSSSNVILLAHESTIDDSSWTIYNLKKPKIESLYKNIEEFAIRFKADNPKMFLSLMFEAHIMVRLMVETARVIPADEMNRQNLKSVPLITFNGTVEPAVDNIFVESCRTLADYFVMQTMEDEYYMALPYYIMGRLNVNEIFNRLIQFEQSGRLMTMTGIVYTLKRLFLRIQPDSDDLGLSTRSNSSKMSNSSDNSTNELMNYRLEKGNIMKILFDLLLKYSPADITNIALQSQIFANRMGDRIYEFLEKRCERTQEENLCLVLQLIRMRNANEARDLIEQFDGRILLNILIKHWPIMFETSLNHKSGSSVVIFSEFTEHCLLCTQNLAIQVVTANILKYLLVNLQVLPFDVLLKLLMDYTAMQIGCEGDGIGRKILLMTLELYLIEYHNQKKNKSLESSLISPMNENNSDVSIKTASSRNNHSFMSDIDSGLSIFGPIATGKALKILVRSYLGQLKSFNLNYNSPKRESNSPTLEPNSRPEFEKLEKDIDLLFEQHKKLNDSQSESLRKLCGDDLNLTESEVTLLRPIVFHNSRLNYLNVMPPLESNILDILLKPIEHFIKNVNLEIKEANLSCVKIQAILCSAEVPQEIINEISHFVYANPSLVGIESIISCLLPTRECIEFLCNVCPQAVLEYAKERVHCDEDWKFVIKCLQQQTDRDATESNGGLLLFFHRLLKETLEYIANVRPLEAVLKIFPDDQINKIQLNNDPDLKDSHYLNEEELSQNPFIENLRRCVEKERAHKIKLVITARNQRKDKKN